MKMKTCKAPFRLALLCLALGLITFSGAQAATRADFYAVFDPAAGQVPFPTNLLFSGSTDGTLNIPVDDPTNLADPRVAMNELDGFSTVAPLTANFSTTLKADTVKAGSTVRVFEVTLTQSFGVAEVKRELRAGTDYSANLLPQDANQTTLNIHPLLPLKPKTGYLGGGGGLPDPPDHAAAAGDSRSPDLASTRSPSRESRLTQLGHTAP